MSPEGLNPLESLFPPQLPIAPEASVNVPLQPEIPQNELAETDILRALKANAFSARGGGRGDRNEPIPSGSQQYAYPPFYQSRERIPFTWKQLGRPENIARQVVAYPFGRSGRRVEIELHEGVKEATDPNRNKKNIAKRAAKRGSKFAIKHLPQLILRTSVDAIPVINLVVDAIYTAYEMNVNARDEDRNMLGIQLGWDLVPGISAIAGFIINRRLITHADATHDAILDDVEAFIKAPYVDPRIREGLAKRIGNVWKKEFKNSQAMVERAQIMSDKNRFNARREAIATTLAMLDPRSQRAADLRAEDFMLYQTLLQVDQRYQYYASQNQDSEYLANNIFFPALQAFPQYFQ